MNYAAVGRRVKQKYPEYADMSDEQVGAVVVQKYPQYRDLAEDQSNPVADFIEKGKKFIGDTAKQITSPAPSMQTPASGNDVAKMFANKNTSVKGLPKERPLNTQGQMGTTNSKNYNGLRDNAKAVGKLGKQITIEAPARAAAGFTLSATGQEEYDPNAAMDEGSKIISKVLFGNDKVKNIQGQGADVSGLAKEFGVNPVVADTAGIPVAAALGGLDLIPGFGGARKKVGEEIIEDTTTQYLKQLKNAQTTARAKEPAQSVIKKIPAVFKEQWIDTFAPIQDALTSAEKKYKFQVRPTMDVREQLGRVLRSNSLGEQFARDNGLFDVIQNIEADKFDEFNQYLIAKQAAKVSGLGKETGRDLAKDQILIADLAPKYEQMAQQTSAYSRKLLDYAVESGLVAAKEAERMKAVYPDYVPLNRIFSELEDSINGVPQGMTKGRSSLSSQTVVKDFKGSDREIEDPISSLVQKTQTAFMQGEKNKAARMLASYKDLPGFEGLIKPLRLAENVEERISLYGKMAELKPIRNSLARMLKTEGRRLRILESEINKLNKQGLNTSLKTQQQPQATPFLPSIVEMKNKEGVVARIDVPMKTTNKGNQATKKFIEDLITSPNKDLEAIKKKIATRDNKLAPLIDEIQVLRGSFDSIKTQRKNLFDEAKLLADAKSRNKATFSTLKNGIKEIYETSPEIAAAAKGLTQEDISKYLKVLNVGARLIQAGAVSLNIPFIARNLVKDQNTAFINSNKAVKTSLLNPGNFMRAFYSVLAHDDLYDDVIRHAGISTSFDAARKQKDLTVAAIRADKNKTSKIKYLATNPKQLLRAAEDIIGKAEELTRVQQYRGTYQALIAEGRTPTDAKILAAKAARENTGDFARAGSYGRVLNYTVPFFNAGIQGTRSFVRNAQKHPAQAAAKTTMSLLMPAAAITLWNVSDPGRKAVYEDIQEWEKKSNFIIVLDGATQDEEGKWNVIKIPLQPGLSNLASIVRDFIEQGANIDPIKTRDIATNLLATGTGQNFDATSLQTLNRSFANNYVPQLFKPGLEIAMNKNLFTGRDIVPENMKDLPPELQVFEYTSPLAIAIGKQTGQSPLLVENVIKSTFAGLGRQALGENIIKQIINSFAKSSGGGVEAKEFEILKEYRQQQALQTEKDKQQAADIVQAFRDPNRTLEEKQQILRALKSPENDSIFDRVKKQLQDEEAGTTSMDKAVRELSVSQRAEWIRSKLDEVVTPEERLTLLESYKKKGILTKSVFDELQVQSQ